jgi:hypothetical protein
LLRSSNELSIPSHAKSRWIISPTPTNNRSPAWNLALHKLKGCTSLRKNWILAINEPDLFAPYAPIYSQPDQKDQVEFAVTDTASVKLSEYQFLFYGHA